MLDGIANHFLIVDIRFRRNFSAQQYHSGFGDSFCNRKRNKIEDYRFVNRVVTALFTILMVRRSQAGYLRLHLEYPRRYRTELRIVFRS